MPSVNRSYAITGVKLSSLFEILGQYGMSQKGFLDIVNIDPSLFEGHEKKLTVSQVAVLLKKALAITRDENLGLKIGSRSRFLPNIVCYIMMNCTTMGEALSKFCRYKQIFTDDTHVRLDRKDCGIFLEMNPESIELSGLRAYSDFLISGMYIFLAFLTRDAFKPVRVHLTHDRPDSILSYQRLFPCPVSFSQPTNALVFAPGAMALPIQCPNRELLDHFEAYAQKAVAGIPGQKALSKRVARMLIEAIQGGDSPSVESIASQLHMSVRKLQGLLEKEATTYKKLLHSAQKQLALAYLADRQISSSEASYLIGYSEPSSFYRAFKRWTGCTPGQYRSAEMTPSGQR